MSKEGDVAAGSLGRSIMSAELYKRSQGRITRQATFAALAITILLGVTLHRHIDGLSLNARYVIDAVIIGVGPAAELPAREHASLRRLLDLRRDRDDEGLVADANRSRAGTSGVVMITIFGLAAVLFIYDIIWQSLLKWIGVLG